MFLLVNSTDNLKTSFGKLLSWLVLIVHIFFLDVCVFLFSPLPFKSIQPHSLLSFGVYLNIPNDAQSKSFSIPYDYNMRYLSVIFLLLGWYVHIVSGGLTVRSILFVLKFNNVCRSSNHSQSIKEDDSFV